MNIIGRKRKYVIFQNIKYILASRGVAGGARKAGEICLYHTLSSKSIVYAIFIILLFSLLFLPYYFPSRRNVFNTSSGWRVGVDWIFSF